MYNYTTLTTAVACDALVTQLESAKEDLQLRKSNLEHQFENFNETSGSTVGELSQVTSELAAKMNSLASYPEGPTKVDLEVEIARLQYKKKDLERDQMKYGTNAVFFKQINIAGVQALIVEHDAVIVSVQNRKAEILAAAA
jgi:hypothetical protein